MRAHVVAASRDGNSNGKGISKSRSHSPRHPVPLLPALAGPLPGPPVVDPPGPGLPLAPLPGSPVLGERRRSPGESMMSRTWRRSCRRCKRCRRRHSNRGWRRSCRRRRSYRRRHSGRAWRHSGRGGSRGRRGDPSVEDDVGRLGVLQPHVALSSNNASNRSMSKKNKIVAVVAGSSSRQ
jgi:hypothetical protein